MSFNIFLIHFCQVERFHELKFSSDVAQQNYDGCNGDPYLIFIKHLKPYFWYLNDTNKSLPGFQGVSLSSGEILNLS